MSFEQIGKTIKQRRAELKITQPHLAELAEISVNTLYKLERGQGNPSLEILTKVCEVLGLVIQLRIKE
jgi:transcriptional regulator with XRE-family HTH domain